MSMRLNKKILAASLLSAAMLAATSTSNFDLSGIRLAPQVVYAEEISPGMDSALDKIISVSDGENPKVSTSERNSIWQLLQNPSKYIGKDTSSATISKIEQALQRPKTLALAAEESENIDTVLSKVQNRLNEIKAKSSDSSEAPVGVTDETKRTMDNLTGNETYSSLYASIVYSLSKGESADSTSISLTQMSKYPVNDETANSQQYGALATPTFNSPAQDAGSQLASYVKTLHEYNYLVMKDNTGFSGIWNFLTSWIGQSTRYFLLSTAWMGAALYDVSFNLIGWFTSEFTRFNILQVTGLQYGAEKADSAINWIFIQILNAIGLDTSMIKTIQAITYLLILGSFIMVVITQLNRAKAKRAVTSTKRYGLRILTIVMTIPITAMMYGVTTSIFSNLNLAAKDASRLSDSYVVNVTKWAGTLNLSLAPISSNRLDTSGEVNEAYAPTPSNIAKLNAAIRTIDEASASDGSKSSAQSAMDSIGSLISDKNASVQDYFNYVASRKTSGSNIAAESIPVTDTTDTRGRTNTYMLVSRDKDKDGSDLLKTIYDLASSSSDGVAADDATKSYTYNVANTKEVSIGLDSKYDLVPVVWNNPTSYLYGAVTPGNLTKSTVNHANYHLSAYTDMLNDPQTGETASDEKLKKALRSNALSFALINKYSGVKQYNGGAESLSSQSVAFLLQSKLSGDTLLYKGYNTAANATGESKNTGAYGITYVENVVPSKDIGDYMNKIASLNAIWLSAGITSFIVLLTLLKAPILGSIVRHLKGFFSALFTGNIIALIESVLYYAALSSSFIFAYFGVLMSLTVVGALIGTEGVASLVSWLSFVPSYGPIVLSWIVCFMLTWPVAKLKLGTSGKSRSVGIASLMVSIPYILVESMDAYMDRMHQRLYGKSRSQSFVNKLSRNAEAIDQGDMIKKKSKKGLDKTLSAIQTVGAAIPGYGTAAAAAAGVVKGALNSSDPNDPNAVIPKTGNALADTALGAVGGALSGESKETKDQDLKDRDISMFDTDIDTLEKAAHHGDLTTLKDEDAQDESLKDRVDEDKDRDEEKTLKVDDVDLEEAERDDELTLLNKIAENTEGLRDDKKSPVEAKLTDLDELSDPDKDTVKEIIKDADSEEDSVKDASIKDASIKDASIKDVDSEDPIKDAKIEASNIDDAKINDAKIDSVSEVSDLRVDDMQSEDKDKSIDSKESKDTTEVEKSLQDNQKPAEFKIFGKNGEYTGKSVADIEAKKSIDGLLNSAVSDVKNLKNAPNNIKAAIDPITSSSLARNISDAVESAATGKTIEQVRMEKSVERTMHDQKILEKEKTDQQYKEVLHDTLIKENVAKGMDPAMASRMASLQEAIGKVASIPGAKIVHQAVQPLAYAADKTLFDGEGIAQSIAKGKDVTSSNNDRQSSEPRYNRSYDEDRKSNEKLSDAIDRLTDQMYNSER